MNLFRQFIPKQCFRHYAFPIGTNNSNILITLASLLPKRCVFFVFITTILLTILCRSSSMNLSAVATLDWAVASCQAPSQLFLREFRSSVPLTRVAFDTLGTWCAPWIRSYFVAVGKRKSDDLRTLPCRTQQTRTSRQWFYFIEKKQPNTRFKSAQRQK